MGWTVNTYSGTHAAGDPSNWRTAMFELCRAVNQRESYAGLTKTTFYNAVGGLAADRVIGDFEDMRWTVASGYPFLNLTRIQAAILALIATGYFVTIDGGETAYTKSSVEAAVGTDLDSNPIRPQEARFWQAQKDALDLLIYMKRLRGNVGNDWTNSNDATKYTRISGLQVDEPTAWSVMLAASSSTTTGAAAGGGTSTGVDILWQTVEAAGSFTSTAHYKWEGVTLKASAALDGLASYYSQAKWAVVGVDNTNGTLSSYGVSIDGAAAETVGLSGTTLIPVSTSDIPLTGERNDISFEVASLPGTNPFSGSPDVGLTDIKLQSAFCYFDLSSGLSDQI